MENDLHNNVDDRVALNSQTINTNTTTAGSIIDTQGYESLEYIIQSGTVTDGAYAIKVEEGDDPGLADAADVPVAEVLGALTGFVSTDDNVTIRVGVIGKKRYQRLSLVSTGVTIGGVFAAVVVLAHPKRAPVAQ